MLILTGAGDKAFCAGGDLKEMSDTALKIPPPDFLPYLQRSVKTDKPVIAAVNGVAFAGGFLLAQMCDLVIAADHAKFGIMEAKVGRGSPVGGAAAVAGRAAGGDGDHAVSAIRSPPSGPTRSGSSTGSCPPTQLRDEALAMASHDRRQRSAVGPSRQAARLPFRRARLERRARGR